VEAQWEACREGLHSLSGRVAPDVCTGVVRDEQRGLHRSARGLPPEHAPALKELSPNCGADRAGLCPATPAASARSAGSGWEVGWPPGLVTEETSIAKEASMATETAGKAC
jgi:hypothetical protein